MPSRSTGNLILERFWQKVDKNTPTGCWNWTGSKGPLGYGSIRIQQQLYRAHRFAYTLLKGTDISGLELDHLCRNPSCVNPDHLEPVTHQENCRRGMWAMKTHCPQGHAYMPENTQHPPGRGRRCRTCSRERNLKRYHEMHGYSPHFQASKTHCKNGHVFDQANTRYRPNGGRVCRTCARDWQRRKTRS